MISVIVTISDEQGRPLSRTKLTDGGLLSAHRVPENLADAVTDLLGDIDPEVTLETLPCQIRVRNFQQRQLRRRR
ncbi:hypothetical protein ACSFA0_23525 [Variovorax sp. LT1P1]|uniref:hypothetical protein n=1 Tax=Variovorax sp. LT1P1 TaxID=3443730 RepID=UPI003F46389C